MAKKKPLADENEPNFEDSLAELEQIVAKLEGGNLGLSDSLAAYEQGVKRLKSCYQMLEHAERRIELVQSVDAAGQIASRPLDDAEEDDLTAKAAARSRRRSVPSSPPANGSVDDEASLF
jgi:exodeoxyribonuclease VII small subunit